MSDRSESIRVPSWAVVLSLCAMCASTSWAVSTQVNNYRLTNITERINSHEASIVVANKDRADISSTLGVIVEQNRRMSQDIAELKEDFRRHGDGQ